MARTVPTGPRAAFARGPRRHGRRPGGLRALLGALTVLAALVPLPTDAIGPFRASGSFERTGPLYVDEPGRLLYQVAGPEIEIRDLDTLARLRAVPNPYGEQDIDATIGGAGTHMTRQLAAVDPAHHHLFHPRRDSSRNLTMAVIDGRTASIDGFALSSPDLSLPTTVPFGVEAVAYFAPTDRLYVLYVLPGGAVALGSNLIGTSGRVWVQEIDPESGAPDWSYRIPECGGVLPSTSYMPPLGRTGDHLYVGCFTGNGLGIAAGLGAVAKLTLSGPGGAPSRSAVFASPGPALLGFYDDVSERTFMNVSGYMATFDGRHGVWVGFAPAANNVGIDPGIGRLYACGNSLQVSDAAVATPVPLGVDYAEVACDNNDPRLIRVDSATRRLFIPVPAESGPRWAAVLDTSDPYVPAPDFNPDQGAEDVAEQLGVTETTFSAQGQAYGTRVVLVGGPMGAIDNVAPLAANVARGAVASQTGIALQESSRELRFAHVRKAKLANDGTEAAAIAVDRDDRFETDLSTARNAVHGKPAHQDDVDQNAAQNGFPGPPPGERFMDLRRQNEASLDEQATANGLPPYSAQPAWPFAMSECQAYNGPMDKPHQGQTGRLQDSSAATCGVDPLGVDASAYAARALDGAVVTVGDSSATVKLGRDPKLGLVATAVAVSRNISIGGQVFIAEARAEATAHARGRPGGAAATYLPSFSGVRILSTDGATIYRCGSDCIPTAVVEGINEALGPRVDARMPVIEKRFLNGTPRGTTASVEQDRWQRVEEQVLYDKPVVEGQEDLTVPAFEVRLNATGLAKSGMIVQFAGVTASAIYRIFRLPQIQPPPPTGPAATTIVETVVAPPTIKPQAPRVVTHTFVDRIRNGVRWIFGWPASAPSVLAGWLLLLSPLYVAARRRAHLRGTSRRVRSG